MDKNLILDQIHELGLLAVLRGPSVDLTLRMVEALVKGGVTGIEITYSTPNAAEVVRNLKECYGNDILIGMGTVTTDVQIEAAVGAGAQFLVSPICSAALIKSMAATGLPVIAGALTPTEVFEAHRLGSDVVKIFPGSLGGPKYMKALRGPMPDIPMMPTGGVNLETIPAWFAAGAFAVGAGSELCPKEWAATGEFEKITQNAKLFTEKVLQGRE